MSSAPATAIRLRAATVDGFLRKARKNRTWLAGRVDKSLGHLTRVLAGERECSWDLLTAMSMALECYPEEIADFVVVGMAA